MDWRETIILNCLGHPVPISQNVNWSNQFGRRCSYHEILIRLSTALYAIILKKLLFLVQMFIQTETGLM